jgi:hypothetical protein
MSLLPNPSSSNSPKLIFQEIVLGSRKNLEIRKNTKITFSKTGKAALPIYSKNKQRSKILVNLRVLLERARFGVRVP